MVVTFYRLICHVETDGLLLMCSHIHTLKMVSIFMTQDGAGKNWPHGLFTPAKVYWVFL